MHSSVDELLGSFYFWSFTNKAAMNIHVQGFHLSWREMLFNLLRNCQTVFQSSCTIYIPTSSVQRIEFLHIFLYIITKHCLFYYRHRGGCEVVSRGFDLPFSDGIYVQYLSMCFLATYISSLEKCLFRSFAH